jgi:predicted dehydrogenase
LAKIYAKPIDIFYEVDADPENSLKTLLAREDIAAIFIVLPIILQPDYIKKCLVAGKHVLSEKPMAPSSQIAKDLIEFHASLSRKPVFAISEPVRFDPSWIKMSELVRQRIAPVHIFTLEYYVGVSEDHPLQAGEWRRNPEYPGGYILDGGVHYMAGLKMVLPEKVQSVSAIGRQIRSHLRPIDTVHAVVCLNDGTTGTFGQSYGSGSFYLEFKVIGEGGIAKLSHMKVSFEPVSGGKEEYAFPEEIWFSEAMRLEYAAFAESIQNGQAHPLGSPEEALGDVIMVISRIL